MIIGIGVLLFVLTAFIWYLCGEVERANKVIGQMEVTISVYEDANKKNAEQAAESAEFNKSIEQMRIDREKTVQEAGIALDETLKGFEDEKGKDDLVRDWASTPLPDYILRGSKTGNKSSH
jgi:cell division protein FtsX